MNITFTCPKRCRWTTSNSPKLIWKELLPIWGVEFTHNYLLSYYHLVFRPVIMYFMLNDTSLDTLSIIIGRGAQRYMYCGWKAADLYQSEIWALRLLIWLLVTCIHPDGWHLVWCERIIDVHFTHTHTHTQFSFSYSYYRLYIRATYEVYMWRFHHTSYTVYSISTATYSVGSLLVAWYVHTVVHNTVASNV